MGAIKGRTAIRVFKKFPYLRERPYWGNHFWAQGYCVDTVGLDAEMIRKYIIYQEKKERETEKRITPPTGRGFKGFLKAQPILRID